KTWNAEGRRLLLDPPAVGDDEPGSIHEAEKIEIAQGLRETKARLGLDPGAVHPFARPRVHGEEDRDPLGEIAQGGEDAAKRFNAVHVARPVERDQRVGARYQGESIERSARSGRFQV